MKKIVGILTVLVLVLFIFGCASKPGLSDSSEDGRPEWVAKMSQKPTNELHFEVGYGKMSTMSTSRTKAMSDARNNLARWVQTDVNTVLKTYTQDAGIGEDRELIEFMEEVSIQTAKIDLSGAEVEDSYIDEDGGVYVLMSYPVDGVGKFLNDTINSYSRNQSAAFAEFKAQEAFRQLQESYQ